MPKYKHNPDTLIILNDITNRVQQLIEANETYIHHIYPDKDEDKMINDQNTAFKSVLVLVDQCIDNGHIMRGNEFFPDSVEPIVKTKWDNRPQLGIVI